MLKLFMVPLLSACALGGTVALIKGIDKAFDIYTSDKASDRAERFSESISGCSEIKNTARKGVLRHFVRILRSKNLTDEQIKEKLLHSFFVSEEELDKILGEAQSGTQI